MHDYFFFFNDTATTEIYTLSLHDALPISGHSGNPRAFAGARLAPWRSFEPATRRSGPIGPRAIPPHGAQPVHRASDRKSTRLNSSHANISYAVFCLKKKKHTQCHIQVLDQ